jgi:glycosyltransferase involved in cell wall biosynthesis
VDVTVITPTIAGREAQLREACASVDAQTTPVRHIVALDWSYQGPAKARNGALKGLSTPWVAFLDDDDLLDPHHVSTLLAASDGADVVIPYCRFAGRTIPSRYCNRPYSREALRRHGIFPITVLARTEAVLAVGGFPSGRYEDWLLWNAMADNGSVFRVVPEVTWTYRLDGDDHRTDAA